VFAVFQVKDNWRVEFVTKTNRIANGIGFTGSNEACNRLQWTVAHLCLHASVQWLSSASQEHACQPGLRANDVHDPAAENQRSVKQARTILEQHGFLIDPLKCSIHRAYVGQGAYPYQWCRITLR
jgi:hypothetical protein